jgi:excisionase family DNA binding protein
MTRLFSNPKQLQARALCYPTRLLCGNYADTLQRCKARKKKVQKMIEEMDATQAAEYLGLKTRQFRAYLSEGLIARESKVVNGKRKDMFTREALDEFKASRARGVKRVKTPEVIPAGEPLPAPVETAVARIQPTLPGIPPPVIGEQIGPEKQADLLAVAFSKTVAIKDKRTLSAQEAAQLFGLPESVIRRAYRDGALRGRKIGRGIRFRPEDVEKFKDSLFE